MSLILPNVITFLPHACVIPEGNVAYIRSHFASYQRRLQPELLQPTAISRKTEEKHYVRIKYIHTPSTTTICVFLLHNSSDSKTRSFSHCLPYIHSFIRSASGIIPHRAANINQQPFSACLIYPDKTKLPVLIADSLTFEHKPSPYILRL